MTRRISSCTSSRSSSGPSIGLHAYLRGQIEEVREVEALLRGSDHFNHRQLALLGDALRGPDTSYTFEAHATAYGVTHETARNDLLQLEEMGLLERRRRGRRYLFSPPPDYLSAWPPSARGRRPRG